MDTIIINDTNLKDERIDKRLDKVRAILIRNDKILMSRYVGVLLFPGGAIDDGETPDEALIRELKEETGIVYDKKDFSPVLTIKHYQENFPTREKIVQNRILTTHYYIGDFKGVDLDNTKRTEKEIKENFRLEMMTIDEMLRVADEPSDNPRKVYFDKEIKEVVKILKLR